MFKEGDALVVWTLYHNPTDYPGQFVLRRALVRKNELIRDREPTCVSPQLSDILAALPAESFFIPRHPNDAPAIVGTWV